MSNPLGAGVLLDGELKEELREGALVSAEKSPWATPECAMFLIQKQSSTEEKLPGKGVGW